MRYANYLRYFLYIARYWNVRLARFVLWHEIKGEHKYQHFASGVAAFPTDVPEHIRQHGSLYQPINFFVAEGLMQTLPTAAKRGAFLDAGCGKGRMLAIAAYHGFTKLYGFDVHAPWTEYAKRSTQQLQARYSQSTWHISTADARCYEVPDEVQVIFLFNPFDEYVMQAFVHQVMQSVERNPRQVYVLYANPVLRHCWEDVGFKEQYHICHLTWLEGLTLHYQPA